jgi:outer membrane receptor protein involved in Fe transport
MFRLRYGPGSARVSLALGLLFASVATRTSAADEPAPAAPKPPPGAPPSPPPKPDDSKAPVEFEALPDIEVRAPTLTPRPVFETTAPVNPITREEMERELPRSFTDAIRFEPGLWSTQGSAGQMGTPVIRGTMGNQVLLLFDGVRVSNSLFAIGPGSDWDLIDMETVDRVEVVRSPDGVLYGTQGIGGATALYSSFPTDYACGGTVLGARSRLLGSTGGENLWRARVEGFVATPAFRVVGGLTRTDADDMVGGGDVGEMSPTRFSSWAGDVRLEARISPCDTLGLSFFGMEKAWPDRFTSPARDYDNGSDREIAIARWFHEAHGCLADDVEVRLAAVHTARLYYRHDKFNRDQQEVWAPQLDVIAHKELACGHSLTYGLHAHDEEISTSVTTTAGKIRAIPDGWLRTAGVYVQDEWTVSPRLRLTAGARFDAVRVETDPEAATTDPLIDPDDIRIDRTDTAWTGKIAAFYRASDSVGLTLNLSTGYRFPGPSDLATFRQAPDEIQVGNPDLDPETSTTLDVGLHVRRPCWRASVVGYVSWLQDLIIGRPGIGPNGTTWLDRNGDAVQDPDEDFAIRTNAGSATFSGIEAEAAVDLTPAWTLFGNFTYWHGDVSPDPTEPIGVPTNGTVGLRYSPCERWWAEASCHMVARFDRIPAAFYDEEQFFWRDPQDPDSGPLRGDHSMPGYATVDLRGGYRVSDRLALTVGIENLLDKEYRPFGSRHAGPGTTFLLSLSIDL